jgi:ABC-type dipeptide/oligopeptide/nickel transport system permease subunit
MLRFSTSLTGALLFAGGAGIVALLGLAGVSTDKEYCDWGYVVRDATTCVESGGLWVARLGGGAFALTVVSIIWNVIRSRNEF